MFRSLAGMVTTCEAAQTQGKEWDKLGTSLAEFEALENTKQLQDPKRLEQPH
jgi:hypothetical protein